MNKKTFFLLTIIILQVSLITYLTLKISRKTNSTQILGTQAQSSQNYQPIPRKPGDPLYHYQEQAPNSTIHARTWLKEKAIYTLNSDGLNERFDYSLEKPENTFRIITLGDSFTFGVAANTINNYPETLEKLLNTQCNAFSKYETINLGKPGYDIEYATKRFEKKGEKYHPNLILWFLKDDDFTEINELYKPIWTQLAKNQKPNDQETWSKMVQQTQNRYNKIYNSKKTLAYNKQALYLFNNHYQKPLVLFTYPFTQSKHIKIMKKFSRSRKNIHFYKKLVDTYKKEDATATDGHPNSKGYQLIAKDLFNYLTQENLLPCK